MPTKTALYQLLRATRNRKRQRYKVISDLFSIRCEPIMYAHKTNSITIEHFNDKTCMEHNLIVIQSRPLAVDGLRPQLSR